MDEKFYRFNDDFEVLDREIKVVVIKFFEVDDIDIVFFGCVD